MKNFALVILLIAVLASCRKENDTRLQDRYSQLTGIWKPLTMSYDSAGVGLIKTIPFERLVIKSNLTYQVFPLTSYPSIEDGTIKIITQNKERLVLFFDAVYPLESSKAGSHIFGFAHVELDSLGISLLQFKAVSNAYYPNTVFRLERYD
jgi:hypothetical protein